MLSMEEFFAKPSEVCKINLNVPVYTLLHLTDGSAQARPVSSMGILRSALQKHQVGIYKAWVLKII